MSDVPIPLNGIPTETGNAMTLQRIPDEILTEIFEHTTAQCNVGRSQDRLKLKQALHLTGVCRWWRVVSIETPSIWDEIYLRFNRPESNDSLEYFRDVLLPRIKERPCNVTITAIQTHTVQAKLKACGIGTLPSIRRLVLSFATTQDLLWVISQQYIVFTCKLDTAQIRHEQGGFSMAISLDIPILLSCMPQLDRLVINRVFYLDFRSGVKNENLTALTITDTAYLDLSKLIVALPNLEMLYIRNSTIMAGDAQTPLEHPLLTTLNLGNIQGIKWMTYVTFTRLTNLVYDDHITDVFTSFVSKHRSIKAIAYKGPSGSISDLANVAPQLTELSTRLPLPAFLKKADPLLFPILESLIVDITPPSAQLTVDEFETLIPNRCLPIGHPKCLATDSSHVIPSISFAGIDATSSPQWFSSQLYQDSFRSNYRTSLYNYDLLRLSWPQ